MLRPAPRHPYVPPSARARNRPRSGGRLLNPAPALPSRPRPSARQRALAQERSYRSQGRAVERTGNRQRRAAQQRVVRRRALAQERAYRSLGQAVERAANRANVQTDMARLRPAPSLHAISRLLLGPFRAQSPRGRLTGRGLPGGTVTPGLFRPGSGPYRIGMDALNFPRNAVISGYDASKAAYGLAGYAPGSPQKGSSREARRLVGGLTRGALGELVVHGDPKAAAKAFKAHPLYSALEVTGAGQVLGRGAGAGARLAGIERASTRRAPLRYGPGRDQVRHRSYSANLAVQEIQRAAERSQRKRGLDPNRAHGTGKYGRQTFELNQQVDEFAAQAEGMRRRGREETVREAARMLPTRRGKEGSRRGRVAAAVDRSIQQTADSTALPGRLSHPRAERDVVLAAVEGRLHGPRTFKRDVRRERDRLQKVYVAERKSWSRPQREANRAQVKALDRVLGDPRALANSEAVFRAAAHYKQVGGKIERELVGAGALDPAQALAAKVRPYAVAHMGARHDPKLRAPEHMAARHAQAREVEAAAKGAVDTARKQVEKAKAARDRLVGVQSSRRGSRMKDGGATATVPERAKLERATAALTTARQARRAAEAKWKQARRERVASDPKKYATGLVDAQGHRITTQQIVEHMRAHPDHGGGAGELDLPGFVSHRLDTRGARSFFVNWWDKRQTVDSKTRTGEATRTGAHASDFAALAEHLVRGRGVVDAIKSFDGFARQVGVKRADGKHYTWAEAQAAAPDMVEAYGQEMVPVRVAPARYDERTRQGILERQDVGSGEQALENLTVRRLDEALREPPQGQTGTRNVVLVPRLQVDRFREHQAMVASAGARVGQAYTRIFRATVLPFSTKWLFGNAAEAVIRSVAYGITPVDLAVRGPKFFDAVKRVDDETFKQLDVRARGGLLYGSGDRLNVHRTDKSFEGSVLEAPAKIIATGVRLPVIRQIGQGLGAYERAVFGLNRAMESRGFQTAVAGKFARKQIQELTGSWGKAIRLEREALDEVARGMLNTPKQVQLARYTDEVLGKYNRFSPATRRITQTIAPFLPWFLNAGRFVYHTLPVKHPAKTALLANIEVTLNREIQDARKKVPPGDLESAIRLKDGGLLPLARYTPFGAFTNLPEGALDPFLPQFTTFYNNMQGRAWTGKELRLASGKTPDRGKRLTMALYALAEGAVPGMAIARRLQEKGRTAFDDSTVLHPKTKKGTSYGASAAERVFNPLRPTYLGAPSSGKTAAKAMKALGLDAADMHDLQQAAKAAGGGLDKADLEELRQLARGGG
jgi:hypothetical protein